MKEKKPKLTPLHWMVYRYLLENTQDEHTTLSQREIYEYCKEQGQSVTWNEKQNQHNDHCRWLARIVDDLNYSLEVDKIIFQHGYRYRIANEEEATFMVMKYDQRIKLAGKRKSVLVRKMRRDGQGKTVTNRCENIVGSKAEPFHSTYRREEDGNEDGK